MKPTQFTLNCNLRHIPQTCEASDTNLSLGVLQQDCVCHATSAEMHWVPLYRAGSWPGMARPVSSACTEVPTNYWSNLTQSRLSHTTHNSNNQHWDTPADTQTIWWALLS